MRVELFGTGAGDDAGAGKVTGSKILGQSVLDDFRVQQGSFALTPERANDADLVAEPGSLLGEGALLVQSQRSGTAIAREDAVVLRISRTMFLRMLDSYPEAAQRLRELLASRADQWAREMENVRTKLARNTGPRS